MTKEEVLQKCTVEGNVVKLPEGQLDRAMYIQVKTALEKIGGKWKGGKINGFVFEQDPSDLLNDIAGGVNRNLKKEFQFFATPQSLADRLVALSNVRESDMILEPSAGRGAIVEAINRVHAGKRVFCCELMPLNREYLSKIKTVAMVGEDFLMLESPEKYDTIIANPPFNKGQDMEHVYKMYECLKRGGRLVSVIFGNWREQPTKKQNEFKQWLNKNEAKIEEVEAGAFKESGTSVGALIVIIDKK